MDYGSFVNLPEFSNMELIGRGSSAIVVKGIHKRTGVPVAIRLLDTRKMANSEYFFREVSVHRRISHPFVAEFYGCLPSGPYICYCLEYVPCGSLLQMINKTKGIPEPQAKRYFCQLMSAIKLLHEGMEVTHRDIKLENLLIDENNNIKIIDFGFVSEQCNLMESQCGTLPYAAPEVVMNQPYGTGVDIWSAGIVLYGMLTGTLPFRAPRGVDLGDIILKETPAFPDKVSVQARSLIMGMLAKDPDQRFTLDDVITHPWMECAYQTYTTDSWLEEVTDTCDFEADLLQPFKGVDISTVYEKITNDDDDESTILYRILKHYSKLQLTSFRGILQSAGQILECGSQPTVNPNSMVALVSQKNLPNLGSSSTYNVNKVPPVAPPVAPKKSPEPVTKLEKIGQIALIARGRNRRVMDISKVQVRKRTAQGIVQQSSIPDLVALGGKSLGVKPNIGAIAPMRRKTITMTGNDPITPSFLSLSE